MDRYKTQILNLIKPLSFEKKVVFAALVCEKLFPNYEYFSEKNQWGETQFLATTISTIYQNVYRSSVFSENLTQGLIDKIEQITPDTEDFEGITVSFALDACTSILSTLNFIIDKNSENIADVAMYARDTVDMYIQERDDMSANDKMLEIKIEQDSFMQREKQRQMAVITLLSEMTEITERQVQILREIQPQPIIDLSLLTLD